MQIRPFDFSDLDYLAYVGVVNAAHPEIARAVADVEHLDKTRGANEVLGRCLVEVGGRVVGLIEYESPRNPKAGALEVRYRVHPNHKSLTPAMWAFLMEEVVKQNPKELQTGGREDWDELAFYREDGFEELDRMWASTLDVQTFDPTPFQKPLADGIEIKPLSAFDWKAPEFQRHWYEMMVSILRDVPSAEPVNPWPFETWQVRHLSNPNLIPEGMFYALEGGRLVGVSELYKSNRPQTLQTGLTGTLSSHRRKGIALALKLRAAEFAKEYGVKYVRTNNHQINRPMLAINEVMGFVKEPAMVFLHKELKP
jgi:GNAT superfamily N-acetyltransferase